MPAGRASMSSEGGAAVRSWDNSLYRNPDSSVVYRRKALAARKAFEEGRQRRETTNSARRRVARRASTMELRSGLSIDELGSVQSDEDAGRSVASAASRISAARRRSMTPRASSVAGGQGAGPLGRVRSAPAWTYDGEPRGREAGNGAGGGARAAGMAGLRSSPVKPRRDTTMRDAVAVSALSRGVAPAVVIDLGEDDAGGAPVTGGGGGVRALPRPSASPQSASTFRLPSPSPMPSVPEDDDTEGSGGRGGGPGGEVAAAPGGGPVPAGHDPYAEAAAALAYVAPDTGVTAASSPEAASVFAAHPGLSQAHGASTSASGAFPLASPVSVGAVAGGSWTYHDTQHAQAPPVAQPPPAVAHEYQVIDEAAREAVEQASRKRRGSVFDASLLKPSRHYERAAPPAHGSAADDYLKRAEYARRRAAEARRPSSAVGRRRSSFKYGPGGFVGAPADRNGHLHDVEHMSRVSEPNSGTLSPPTTTTATTTPLSSSVGTLSPRGSAHSSPRGGAHAAHHHAPATDSGGRSPRSWGGVGHPAAPGGAPHSGAASPFADGGADGVSEGDVLALLAQLRTIVEAQQAHLSSLVASSAATVQYDSAKATLDRAKEELQQLTAVARQSVGGGGDASNASGTLMLSGVSGGTAVSPGEGGGLSLSISTIKGARGAEDAEGAADGALSGTTAHALREENRKLRERQAVIAAEMARLTAAMAEYDARAPRRRDGSGDGSGDGGGDGGGGDGDGADSGEDVQTATIKALQEQIHVLTRDRAQLSSELRDATDASRRLQNELDEMGHVAREKEELQRTVASLRSALNQARAQCASLAAQSAAASRQAPRDARRVSP